MATKIVIPHNLKFIPTDVIISAIIPQPGATRVANVRVLYNDKDFNNKTIAVEVDQPCKLRVFAGSYEEKKR